MTTPSSPALAFVLPIRNYPAEAMRRCIESIRRQAGPDVADIVLADFGSSPEHADAVRALAADCNARHVWFDERGPWNRSRAINLGVRATNAPILVTSDADLVFATNFTQTVLETAKKSGVAFYAHAPMMDLLPNLTVDLNDYDADYDRLLAVAKERIWSRGNVIFSRALFDYMRGWEEAYTIWGCEDNDFFDRATRSGARVFDLKGMTSYLHHWHPSNKRGREAGAQVARNQLMFWPLEKKIPVRRTGPFADESALPEHIPFQTPTVSIVITDAADKARAEATLASLDTQTFQDADVQLAAGTLGRGPLPEMTGDVIGLIPAGTILPNDDALTWQVLIPLLKGETPSLSFMWRKPSTYTPARQILNTSLPPTPPAPAPPQTKAPLFGNYGATKSYALPEAIKTAMLFSRAPIEGDTDLADAIAGEKTIAEMDEANFAILQAQRAENPGDPYFDFWSGLIHMERGEHRAAYEALAKALQAGLNHWRVAWNLAQAAAKVGDVANVDHICQQIVKGMPRFWFARELPKHARGHYAQTDQEQIIEKFFRAARPRDRVFVEVGGFDGVHYSNVRRLQESGGWTGLSVEPVEKNYKKLVKSYKGRPVVCVRAAVGTQAGEAELHVSTYPHLADWGSDVATFVPDRKTEWVDKFGAEWVVERVPVKPLTAILDENGITRFDLLSIDVEGHDLAVLQSLDFARFRPQLIIIEYGKDRAPILSFMTEKGYTLYHDNGVDLFMSDNAASIAPPPREIPRALASARLNPHLLTLLEVPENVPVSILPAHQLLDGRRFDIAIKYLYAQARYAKISCDFAKRAYLAHIGVFNGFQEGDQTGKSGPEAFVAAFDTIVDHIASKGFNEMTSSVPVDRHGVVIDGAHRVAACLAADVRVTCLTLPTDAKIYDYRYFRDRDKFVAGGLERQYADAAALAYARLKSNTHVVSLFPSAPGRDADVHAILARYGRVVYAKDCAIAPQAAPLLMRQVYEQEPWLGDWSNNFKGAQNKGGKCFAADGPLRAILIETDAPEALRACKTEIRALYPSGQHAVHINDTHAETETLARIYFNDNSIAFLNSARPQPYGPFNEQFARYRAVLKDGGFDTENFCIEGSAIMAAYGIRTSRDLDYLSLRDQAPDFGTKLIGNHASELKHHVLSRDDIIFDPANHFYFFGLKVATLDVLRGMKAKRAEKPKDFDDIKLIDDWRTR
jgi:FkbM family methyltransferase